MHRTSTFLQLFHSRREASSELPRQGELYSSNSLDLAAHSRLKRGILTLDPAQIRLDHHMDHSFQGCLAFPAKMSPRFGRVTNQKIDFGRAVKSRVDNHVVLVVQSHVRERHSTHIPYRGSRSGGDDIVAWFWLLQHHPHCFNIIARIAPIPLRVHIAKPELLLAAQVNPGYGVRHLAGYKLYSAERRFVIEQYS